MKTNLAVALVLASSTFVAAAAADSACVPSLLCRPVIDAGTCSRQASGSLCAGDAGACGIVDKGCGGDSTTPVCLGALPPEPPCGGSSGCNCKIGVDPSGAAKRAALPLFLLVAGASALLLDRRRRNRPGA